MTLAHTPDQFDDLLAEVNGWLSDPTTSPYYRARYPEEEIEDDTASKAQARQSAFPLIQGFQRGVVQPDDDHILFTYGDMAHESWNGGVAVARMAKPVEGIFTVQCLLEPLNEINVEMLSETLHKVYSVLCRDMRTTPWDYALYHTATAANIYSNVHWIHAGREARLQAEREAAEDEAYRQSLAAMPPPAAAPTPSDQPGDVVQASPAITSSEPGSKPPERPFLVKMVTLYLFAAISAAVIALLIFVGGEMLGILH